MIKVIAFDLVGVLVREKDIELTEVEDKLERMFGDNINDEGYILEASKLIDEDSIIETTKNIIEKLYQIRDKELFQKIRNKYPNIKLIVATNHVSYVRDYINNNFNCDNILISAEIHKIKPNSDFYQHILNKYDINPNELLFLDDNIKNIDGANNLGIKTIKVNKDTDLFNEIENIL